jgi:hypothetical protein
MKRSKPVKTLNSALDAAEICRRNGWRKGTQLVGEEDGVAAILRITAVGEQEILAKFVGGIDGYHDSEMATDLSCREWRKVTK